MWYWGQIFLSMQKTWVWSLGWKDSPRGGNGNPCLYSCLENSKDWRTQRAAVHGVTKSQTWLSNWAQHSRAARTTACIQNFSRCHWKQPKKDFDESKFELNSALRTTRGLRIFCIWLIVSPWERGNRHQGVLLYEKCIIFILLLIPGGVPWLSAEDLY